MPFSICFNVGLIPLQHFLVPSFHDVTDKLRGTIPSRFDWCKYTPTLWSNWYRRHTANICFTPMRWSDWCELETANICLTPMRWPDWCELQTANIWFTPFPIPHSTFINIPFNLTITDRLKSAVKVDEKKWVGWAILTLNRDLIILEYPLFAFLTVNVICIRTMLINSHILVWVCARGFKLLVYLIDRLSNNISNNKLSCSLRILPAIYFVD